jgi:hypothetical protein
MAVEIVKGTGPATYGSFDPMGYQLAQFFSASDHFDIIDSYSSHWWNNYPATDPKTYGARRYKGDPMVAPSPGDPAERGSLAVWDSSDDVGELDWIVIECKTSIFTGLGTNIPKWQAKIQWHGNSYGWDVSDPNPGGIYANSYWRRAIRSRMSPWGGWDLADVTPDFRPAGKPYPASCENHGWALGHGGSGNSTRWYAVADTGGFLTFNRRNQTAYDLMGLGCYMGDFRPPIPGVHPNSRVFLSSGDFSWNAMQGVGTNRMLSEESYVNSYGRIQLPEHDDDGTWIASNYRVPTGWLIMENGISVPNGQSSNFELDTFPYMPIPTSRRGVTGDIPMIRKGYGVGYTLVANKQWVSTGPGYGLYLIWDGATSLY